MNHPPRMPVSNPGCSPANLPAAQSARYIGVVSLNVYLWHIPTLMRIGNHFCADPALVALAVIVLALLFSEISYLLIERPSFGHASHGGASRCRPLGASLGSEEKGFHPVQRAVCIEPPWQFSRTSQSGSSTLSSQSRFFARSDTEAQRTTRPDPCCPDCQLEAGNLHRRQKRNSQ